MLGCWMIVVLGRWMRILLIEFLLSWMKMRMFRVLRMFFFKIRLKLWKGVGEIYIRENGRVWISIFSRSSSSGSFGLFVVGCCYIWEFLILCVCEQREGFIYVFENLNLVVGLYISLCIIGYVGCQWCGIFLWLCVDGYWIMEDLLLQMC